MDAYTYAVYILKVDIVRNVIVEGKERIVGRFRQIDRIMTILKGKS